MPLLRAFFSLFSTSLRSRKAEHFSPELEQRYQQFIGPEKIRTIRLACALANFTTLPFAVLDVWALPDAYVTTWRMRIVGFAFVTAVYFATLKPKFLDRYTPIGVALFVAQGLMLEAPVAISLVYVLVYAAIGFGLHEAAAKGAMAITVTNLMFMSSAALVGLVAQVGRDQRGLTLKAQPKSHLFKARVSQSPMATSKSPTLGRSNSPRQDMLIINHL